jgi:hypothetical protein
VNDSPDLPPDPDIAALRAEIDRVERDVVGHVEPGRWAMVIAVAVFALLVAELLPWVGSNSGWEVLLGRVSGVPRIGLLPRLFAGSALTFGVLFSAVTLFTRRWGLAWLCALGSAFSVVHGLWAVWSRQTAVDDAAPGPGPGMVLALLTMIVLAVQWLRLAFSRP